LEAGISIDSKYLKTEKTFVVTFLLIVSLTLAHFVHESWFISIATNGEAPFQSVYAKYAPMAYRVAMPTLGLFLMRVLSIRDSSIVAGLLDLFFSFPALYLFYKLTVRNFSSAASRTQRIVALAFFLAFIQFPMAWVTPWRRPETLPTAFFLAAALALLTSTGKTGLRLVLLLALTVWQSFVRSDVPFIFGLALILTSLMKNSIAQLGSRRLNFLFGAAIAGVAAGIQLYLQFVRFPHLSYPPGTNVNKFLFNFGVHYLADFTLALLPVFLLIGMLIIARPRLDAVDLIILLTSAIYLPLWFTVGVISEVRIYVPFLLALSVVAAKISASTLLGQSTAEATQFNV